MAPSPTSLAKQQRPVCGNDNGIVKVEAPEIVRVPHCRQWGAGNSRTEHTFPIVFQHIVQLVVVPYHLDGNIYPAQGLSTTYYTGWWRANMAETYDCRFIAVGY